MKIFKLANIEYKKFFWRPAIFFMMIFLGIVLILFSFLFAPKQQLSHLTNFGTQTETVGEAFAHFNFEEGENSKFALDEKLDKAHTYLVEFGNESSVKTELYNLANEINQKIVSTTDANSLTVLLQKFLQSEATRQDLNKCLTGDTNSIRNLEIRLNNKIVQLQSNTNIDFFATKPTLANLQNQIKSSSNFIPSSVDSLTDEQIVKLANDVISSHNFANVVNEISLLTKIEIGNDKKDFILNNYYTPIAYQTDSNSILTTMFENIVKFQEENFSSTEQKDKTELNKLITQYKNATNIACNLILNSLTFEKSANKNVYELNTYVGFENINLYDVNENLSLNKYFLNNNLFSSDYCLNYNFNNTSSSSTTVYDFLFSGMQLLGVFITIFCIFFIVLSTNNEIKNGTLKFVASRPYTKRKILLGKFLACFNLMLTLVAVCAIACLMLGFAKYGFSFNTVYMVLNSTTVFAIPDFLAIIIYLFFLILNITFFIALALLFSIVCKSNIWSILLSLCVYIATLITSMLCYAKSWFMFTPFAHLDLFKYLGNAGATNGFLSMNVANGSLLISATISIVFTIIFITCATEIFKKRDL